MAKVTITSSNDHDPEQMKHLAKKTGDTHIAKDRKGTTEYGPDGSVKKS